MDKYLKKWRETNKQSNRVPASPEERRQSELDRKWQEAMLKAQMKGK